MATALSQQVQCSYLQCCVRSRHTHTHTHHDQKYSAEERRQRDHWSDIDRNDESRKRFNHKNKDKTSLTVLFAQEEKSFRAALKPKKEISLGLLKHLSLFEHKSLR